MKRKVGLWIDHRKTIIVAISNEAEEIKRITSHLERDARPSGGWVAHSGRDYKSEDLQDRRFMGHLDIYYDEVISFIRDAESILILGPGEAKGELKKRMESKGLGGRIVGVETVDKMRDGQIAAKVRQYFLNLK
jgi:hypothetical protein